MLPVSFFIYLYVYLRFLSKRLKVSPSCSLLPRVKCIERGQLAKQQQVFVMWGTVCLPARQKGQGPLFQKRLFEEIEGVTLEPPCTPSQTRECLGSLQALSLSSQVEAKNREEVILGRRVSL